MSLTISLDAADVRFAGISMIVLARVLAFIAPCDAQVAAFVTHQSYIRSSVNFLLKTFVAGQCGAANDGTLCCAAFYE
jgi:hypothetical protein